MTTIHTTARPGDGGVDTHKHVHVAAVIDQSAGSLATAAFPTTGTATGSCWMAARPRRARRRRRRGLRFVGCRPGPTPHRWRRSSHRGQPTEPPEPPAPRQVRRDRRRSRGTGRARRRRHASPPRPDRPRRGGPPAAGGRAGAMKARTAAANQLHSLCDTAPDVVRAQLAGLSVEAEGRHRRTVATRRRHDRRSVGTARPAQRRSPLAQPRRRSSSTPSRHPGHPRRDRPPPARRPRRRL